MHYFKKSVALLVLGSFISSTAFPTASWARGETASVSIDQPCGDTDKINLDSMKSDSLSKTISAGGQKNRLTHCAARKAALEAAKGNEIVAIAQTAVFIVCGVACASSFWSFGVTEGWCTITNLAGTGVSVLAAKETSEKMMALTGLIGPGMQLMQKGGAAAMFDISFSGEQAAQAAAREGAIKTAQETAATTATEAAKEGATQATKDAAQKAAENAAAETGEKAASDAASHMSCLTAAGAGVQALINSEAKKNANATAKNEEDAARMVVDSDLRHFGESGSLAVGSVAKTEPGGVGSGTAAPNDSGSPPRESNIAKGFDAIMSAAVSQPNSGVPAFVASPKFRDVLEKISGMSADRLASLNSPMAMAQAGMGRILSAEGREKLDGILSNAQRLVRAELQTGTYARSGGGSKGGGGDGMPDLNALMDKFMPKEAEKAANGKVGDINFGKKQLVATKAGDEENSGISIFDRITRRYQMSLSQDRVTQLPYQTRENRSLSTH